ncbi:MAG: threonine dehydrogenase-like Zn-dependent dehydrogenase, partial [Verrucomicrobiales bacterium]
MDAIQFTAKCEARLVDVDEVQSPAANQAIVRTHRMGICGTDISAFHGKFPFFQFPRIPGHELGVEVVAVGEQVDNVMPGDRCALEPYFNDPESPTSKRGLTNCCTELQVFGVHCDGGLRNGTYSVPAHKLHPGNDLGFDQLALVEPLAIGYHAVQRGAPRPGENVLVIGAGPIGLACLEFLKLHDVKLQVMDLDPARLNFCRERFEISADDPPADLIIDATGSAHSMSTCLEHANFGGRIVYVGVTQDEVHFAHAPIFHRRELTLIASRNALSADFPNIIQILSDGSIDLAPWMTHRISLQEVPERFAEVTHPDSGVIKAM